MMNAAMLWVLGSTGISTLPTAHQGVVSGAPVHLSAVTARDQNSLEVRIRWQFLSGWIPASGVRLYQVKGGAKTLVYSSQTLSDATLPVKLRGSSLLSKAFPAGVVVPNLTLSRPRGQSSGAKFNLRKNLVTELGQLDTPVLSAGQRSAKSLKAQQLKATKTGASSLVPKLAVKDAAATALAARTQLTFASLIKPDLAESLAMGARDKSVSLGQSVGYELYEAGPGGSNGKLLAMLAPFEVGASVAPPSVSGFEFVQEDGTVSMRWTRLPELLEKDLLAVSYIVRRKSSALTGGSEAFEPVTVEPLVVLDGADGVEPVSFLTDKLKAPGAYTYEITTVDGYGRRSAPATFPVVVRDWRRPSPPTRAFSTLLAGLNRPIRPSVVSLIKPTPVANAKTIRIAWTSEAPPAGLQVRYHIYRYDLDASDAAPIRITQAPIAGSPVPVGTDAELQDAMDAVLGPEFGDAQDRAVVDAERLAKSAVGAQAQEAAIALAKARAKVEATRKSLRVSWTSRPPLTYSLPVSENDKRYSFTVTALYENPGLESGETPAGAVLLPDFRVPSAPTGLGASFTANPALTAKPAPARLFSLPTLTFGGIRKSKGTAVKLLSPKTLGKLNLTANDFGGKVAVRWSPVAGLTSPRYSIERKVGNEAYVEVGLSKESEASFVDNVPRSGVRTYTYRVAAVSRWNVKGSPAELSVEVPATVPPQSPAVLSVRPTGDRKLGIKVRKPAISEGVTRLVILRDNAEVGSLALAASAEPSVTFTDANLQENREYTYQVKGVTGAGLSSSPSVGLKGKAVKTTVAAVTNLVATATAKGVRLNWTLSADAATYLVRRRVGTDPEEVLSADATGSTYLDFTTFVGRTYSYVVIPVAANGTQGIPTTVQVSVTSAP